MVSTNHNFRMSDLAIPLHSRRYSLPYRSETRSWQQSSTTAAGSTQPSPPSTGGALPPTSPPPQLPGTPQSTEVPQSFSREGEADGTPRLTTVALHGLTSKLRARGLSGELAIAPKTLLGVLSFVIERFYYGMFWDGVEVGRKQ